MWAARVSLLIFLLVTLSGCTVMGEIQSKVLLRQANEVDGAGHGRYAEVE